MDIVLWPLADGPSLSGRLPGMSFGQRSPAIFFRELFQGERDPDEFRLIGHQRQLPVALPRETSCC
ncbi:MAG: hypothetical protein ACETWK_06845 [Candidatus Aminicenantaceae bacterium]